MIASLPMYLRPETRGALDIFWNLTAQGLRARGISAPDRLSHDAPVVECWGRDDLVLGQICNLPYRARFRDTVTLIGAADFGLPGAGPGQYLSHIVARAGDPRPTLDDFDGARFALNGFDSHSGWASPWMSFERLNLSPSSFHVTGAHRASARAVAEDRADFASIDAQSYALMDRWDPALTAGLRIVADTDPSPGISFITAGKVDPAPYRAALQDALSALPEDARDTLMLRAIVPLPEAAYTDLPIPPQPACPLPA
ncbi:phosphate/phosphite/phosphonate ABC transporter substrate-binding protein [Hasllibacter sp. MH4015]|uniref:phosphate/phosphite/phosphonate ABC transporter substrate-binding protein n=1 Tax=Hasllibacter sp. MH4015 TaxID=2854029 RepID=UPI001CD6DC8C|nr:PhnD/SsuA/transferrin family substrate-binding protein [Hasllibacter sp. MH4015]